MRERLLLAAGILIAGLLLAALVYAALIEVGGKNSAALMADAFLRGRLWVDTCFDLDCARVNGRTYVVFPPFPGVAALPLVAIGGATTFGFISLTTLFLFLSLLIWIRVFRRLGVSNPAWFWLVLAVGFSRRRHLVFRPGNRVPDDQPGHT